MDNPELARQGWPHRAAQRRHCVAIRDAGRFKVAGALARVIGLCQCSRERLVPAGPLGGGTIVRVRSIATRYDAEVTSSRISSTPVTTITSRCGRSREVVRERLVEVVCKGPQLVLEFRERFAVGQRGPGLGIT